MEAIVFYKRVGDSIGMPYLGEEAERHYGKTNEQIQLYMHHDDGDFTADIYLKNCDRWLFVFYTQRDGYWLQENFEDGIEELKERKYLLPVLKALKKELNKSLSMC